MQKVPNIWLFVLLVLVGAVAGAADPSQQASDPREADAPTILAAPTALPSSARTELDAEAAQVLGGGTTTAVAPAALAASSVSRRHYREAEWLDFRRPFTETVSYRATAPPPRFG